MEVTFISPDFLNVCAFFVSVDPVRAVVAHTVRVNSEGRCKKPLPKVIPVQSEHPDVSKTYIPHCTILHRCAEDTGCCNNYGTRCAPKKLKLVHLYFYVSINILKPQLSVCCLKLSFVRDQRVEKGLEGCNSLCHIY